MKKLCLNLCVLCFVIFVSCVPYANSKQNQEVKTVVVERKYDVRLSNWVGSDYYNCDSVIWESDSRIKLKNKEDKSSFIEILIPDGVTVRVTLNNNYKN